MGNHILAVSLGVARCRPLLPLAAAGLSRFRCEESSENASLSSYQRTFKEAFTGERTVSACVCPVILGAFATLVYF